MNEEKREWITTLVIIPGVPVAVGAGLLGWSIWEYHHGQASWIDFWTGVYVILLHIIGVLVKFIVPLYFVGLPEEGYDPDQRDEKKLRKDQSDQPLIH